MKKKAYIFGLIFLFCVFVITSLFFYSRRDINGKNGFVRNFSKEKIQLRGSVDLESEDLYSISEITNNYITLYKFNKPIELLMITTDLKKKKPDTLPFPSDKKKIGGLNTVGFLGSSTILLTGKTSIAYISSHKSNSFKENKLDSLPFYHSEILSANSFIVLSKVQHQGITRRKLKKVNLDAQELSFYFPEKQKDGYFSTDGQFRFNKDSKRLVYMFYYRGGFICLDTNLNEIYTAKTIDTVHYAKINLKPVEKLINGEKKVMKLVQSTPPNIVNKRLCLTKDRIYIQSNLKSDNDQADDFRPQETIDVYDLHNGQYINSFYLPKIGDLKLTEFKVHNNCIIAIYRNKLAIFDIKQT